MEYIVKLLKVGIVFRFFGGRLSILLNVLYKLIWIGGYKLEMCWF